MNAIDVFEGDVLYLTFYLKEKDLTTGSITYYDISGANSIVFRMRKYGETVNTISSTMEIVTGSLGHCRVLTTIPSSGTYSSEIEVYEGSQHITWQGPVYNVLEALG